MFGSLGFPELLFIFTLALLFFGPSKLPEVGRTVGKAMAEFRKATQDFKRTLNAEALEREMREADPRKVVRDTLADAKRDLDDALEGRGSAAAESETEPDSASEDASDSASDDASSTSPADEPETVARGSAPGPPAAGDGA